MVGDAYWVSPSGAIIGVDAKKHIQVLINNPKKFGETEDSIKKTFDKYNEPVGSEGKAREEIIIRVIKRGFVRIREYRNHWSVQVYKLTNKVADVIWMWAKQIINKVSDKFADVKITELGKSNSKVIQKSLKKISDGVNITERKREFKDIFNLPSLVFVESIENFPDFS